MLKTSKIICFAATTKPARAKKFYRGTLGLALVEDGPFALVFDANGTMLRVQKVGELRPATHTALGWRVADIRAAIKQLTRKGVRFQRYEGLPQDAAGVWTTPSGSLVAWFKDPDGNTLSLTEFRRK
jgi:catechol 2,3-dioxygenase-like lactoylglutathione lyase family enzyme